MFLVGFFSIFLLFSATYPDCLCRNNIVEKILNYLRKFCEVCLMCIHTLQVTAIRNGMWDNIYDTLQAIGSNDSNGTVTDEPSQYETIDVLPCQKNAVGTATFGSAELRGECLLKFFSLGKLMVDSWGLYNGMRTVAFAHLHSYTYGLFFTSWNFQYNPYY